MMRETIQNWAEPILYWADQKPEQIALRHGPDVMTYQALAMHARQTAIFLNSQGVKVGDRVGFYMLKSLNGVASMAGAALLGCVVVPINPALKDAQIDYVLENAGVTAFVSNQARLNQLCAMLDRHKIAIRIDPATLDAPDGCFGVPDLMQAEGSFDVHRNPGDLAILFYTSGSTGLPKGVMVSHDNVFGGAEVVSGYLGLETSDRILAVPPLSFDYGFNQISSAFWVGAQAILLDYLFPKDVKRAVEQAKATVLPCVPPLWHQLMATPWIEASSSLRILTNTGGKLPVELIEKMRACFPDAEMFSMYGLTEAFRSTYLDPEEIDRIPNSIGKAIPGEEILVMRDEDHIADDEEVGELVHIGRMVTQGYWRDDEKTLQKFRPVPECSRFYGRYETAVWSGDKVWRDADGFLYFIGRDDEMIKTSGYRVSPTELEAAAIRCPGIDQAFAVGIPHLKLGEAIHMVLMGDAAWRPADDEFLTALKAIIPTFMVPATIEWVDQMPIGPNGKIDRAQLRKQAFERQGHGG